MKSAPSRGERVLVLPWPPSGNHRYGYNRRTGRPFINRAYRRFLDAVMVMLVRHGVRPFPGRVGVRLDAYPGTNRARDEDNLVKPVFDALKCRGGPFGLFLDDRHAHIEAVRIHPKDPARPRVEVRARPLPSPPGPGEDRHDIPRPAPLSVLPAPGGGA